MPTYQDTPNDFPDFAVEIAFTTNPGAAPTWTDVSTYVRGFTVKRGRQDELARVEASVATVTLDNNDRRFDPTYTSSPYYPNVVPMRRIRIFARWSAVEYARFHGFIEAWDLDYLGATGIDAAVQLSCVDLFKTLNLFELQGPAWAEELTGARVGNVLDEVAWPAGERTVDAGSFTVVEETAADTTVSPAVAATATGSALTYLHEVADAEGGLFFIAPDGKATFQDRRHRKDDESASAITFGDSGTELPYRELGPAFDDSRLVNEANVSYRPSGVEVASDAASQTKYLKRSRAISTRLAKAGEAAAIASLQVFRWKEPALRVSPIVVEPARDYSTFWAGVLARDISDRVTVKRRPTDRAGVAVGSAISQDCHVEGITEAFLNDPRRGWSYVFTFTVSPVEPTLSEWTLGTSVLDTSTYVGY